MASLIELRSNSPEETEALGMRLAACLAPGLVVAFRGDLGAGKTCMAKGIARGLGVEDTVTSPTYTIVSEYQGRFPLYHIDAYRLNGDEDFENAGALDYLGGDGVALVEWSERVPRSIPRGAITITVKISGASSRVFCIEGIEKIK